MWAPLVLIVSSTICLGLAGSAAPNWAAYHDEKQLVEALEDVARRCPNISQLYTVGESVEGRPLVAIQLSTTPGRRETLKPEVRYVANMHGNEVVGRELLVRLAYELCQGWLSGDVETRELLNSTSIHLMPSMNPDGFALAYNMAPEQRTWVTGRTNARGIDLNRDFPDLDSLYYRLQEAGAPQLDHLLELFEDSHKRQPETVAVGRWILNWPWVLSANLHEGDLVANYPFDVSSKPQATAYAASPDDHTFRWLASTYAQNHAHMAKNDHAPCDGRASDAFALQGGITNGAHWYPVAGGMQDFVYLATNAMETTLELSCEKLPPAAQLPQFWEDNRRALLAYLWRANAGIKGLVGDAVSGEPIQGAVLLVWNSTAEGQKTSARPIAHQVVTWTDGDYHRILPPGHYEVSVSAPGYLSASRHVEVTNAHRDAAHRLDFVLIPENEINDVVADLEAAAAVAAEASADEAAATSAPPQHM